MDVSKSAASPVVSPVASQTLAQRIPTVTTNQVLMGASLLMGGLFLLTPPGAVLTLGLALLLPATGAAAVGIAATVMAVGAALASFGALFGLKKLDVVGKVSGLYNRVFAKKESPESPESQKSSRSVSPIVEPSQPYVIPQRRNGDLEARAGDLQVDADGVAQQLEIEGQDTADTDGHDTLSRVSSLSFMSSPASRAASPTENPAELDESESESSRTVLEV